MSEETLVQVPVIESQPVAEVPDPRTESAARQLINTPVLLDESEFDRLMSIPARSGVNPEAFFHFFDDMDDDGGLDIRGGVAVIGITGTLFDWRYDAIGEKVTAALGNSSVRGILFDIDSGGGSVDGNFDLVDFLFEVAKEKPIWAIANHFAASAAFNIASVAKNIGVTRTAGIGSVGVIAKHLEFSKMDAQQGLTFTTVFAGARKNDFSDTEPFSKTAKAILQTDVDELYGIFTGQVARNRGLDVSSVVATEAGMFHREAAIEAGFADEVTDFDSFLEKFQNSLNAVPNSSGRSLTTADVPHNNEAISMDNDTPEAGGTEPVAETTNVRDISEARSQGADDAREQMRAETQEIAQLCSLAGCPDRVAGFIEAGNTPSQVREALVNDRADRSDATDPVNSAQPGEDFSSARINPRAIYARRAEEAEAGRDRYASRRADAQVGGN